MAKMGAVLEDLRKEIVKKVYGVGREILPGQMWDVHEPNDASPFEEQAATRRFKVGWWRPTRYTFGTSHRLYDVAGAVKIHYGRTDEEQTAAAADYDAISRALIDTNPTSTGVHFYEVPAGTELPEPEETGEGDGILLTIPLHAVIETTE